MRTARTVSDIKKLPSVIFDHYSMGGRENKGEIDMSEKLKAALAHAVEAEGKLSEVEAAFVAGMMEGMCKAKGMELEEKPEEA